MSDDGPVTGEHIDIRKGEDYSVAFMVDGAAGATAASFHMAASRTSSVHDIDLTQISGVEISTVGTQGKVVVRMTRTQTANLPWTGLRYFEVTTTKNGDRRTVTEGTAGILPSLMGP